MDIDVVEGTRRRDSAAQDRREQHRDALVAAAAIAPDGDVVTSDGDDLTPLVGASPFSTSDCSSSRRHNACNDHVATK